MRSTPFIQARAAQSVELSHVFMYRGVARKTRRYAHFLLRIFPATNRAMFAPASGLGSPA